MCSWLGGEHFWLHMRRVVSCDVEMLSNAIGGLTTLGGIEPSWEMHDAACDAAVVRLGPSWTARADELYSQPALQSNPNCCSHVKIGMHMSPIRHLASVCFVHS